ncbi:hypothetical protein V1477_015857 [Vespula maculifrons]|uniref:Uncharacterized protein n=1 Tax=Vespula maculifrons TaxID=7453 RepID=A0ABD2BBD6_VESMC
MFSGNRTIKMMTFMRRKHRFKIHDTHYGEYYILKIAVTKEKKKNMEKFSQADIDRSVWGALEVSNFTGRFLNCIPLLMKIQFSRFGAVGSL